MSPYQSALRSQREREREREREQCALARYTVHSPRVGRLSARRARPAIFRAPRARGGGLGSLARGGRNPDVNLPLAHIPLRLGQPAQQGTPSAPPLNRAARARRTEYHRARPPLTASEERARRDTAAHTALPLPTQCAAVRDDAPGPLHSTAPNSPARLPRVRWPSRAYPPIRQHGRVDVVQNVGEWHAARWRARA
jgi:hypothetical protein